MGFRDQHHLLQCHRRRKERMSQHAAQAGTPFLQEPAEMTGDAGKWRCATREDALCARGRDCGRNIMRVCVKVTGV